MSKNKMGGVPSETRNALYGFFDKMQSADDKTWARVIREIMTRVGPRESLKRLTPQETQEAKG